MTADPFPEPVQQAIEAGFAVVPTDINRRPHVRWKKWYSEPQTDDDRSQFGHGSLWAAVTGERSNVVVLDFDGPSGMATLENSFPGLKPHVLTGGGGAHVYVVHPGHPVKSSAKKFKQFPGLDIKGDKSLAFFYGRSKKGEYEPVDWPPFPYELDADTAETLFPHPQEDRANRVAPGQFEGPVPEATRYLVRACQYIRESESGTSNSELNKHAFAVGGLVASGQLPEDRAYDDLLAAAVDRGCGTPEAVIRSSMAAGAVKPWAFDPEEDEWIPAVAVKLFRRGQVPEPVPFPVDALPPVLEDYVTKGSEAVSCPPDYIGAGLLTVLGLAIGNNVRLQINETWFEHAAIWTALVGPPGARKSPAMKLVLKPVRDAQRNLEEVAKQEAAANDLDWSEVKPPRLIVDDATIEALFGVLERNPRGVTMRADELAGWVTGMNQYKGGVGRDRQHWLSIWSREDVYVDRVKAADRSVREPFVSVLGGIQPEPLEDLIHSKDDGLLPRLLLAQGEYVKPRLRRGALDPSLADAYVELWNDIRDKSMFDEVVEFTDSGYLAFETWVNSHYDTLEHLPGELRGAWAKMDGQAGRLCLILAKSLGREKVDTDVVERAITLIGYFMGQAAGLLRGSSSGTPWEKKHAGRLQSLADFLAENPGAGRAEVMAGLGADWALDNRTLDRMLETMSQVGLWGGGSK